MDTPIGCGMMGFAETSGPLCAGLERLKEEHVPFWKEMGALEASARSIGSDARGENGEEALRALGEGAHLHLAPAEGARDVLGAEGRWGGGLGAHARRS